MDGSEALDAGSVDALEGSYPEFEVGIYGVLDQYGYVNAFEAVSDGLYGEGVGCGACAYPQDVDAVFEGELYMLGCGNFCGCEHACLFLDLLHPWECYLTVAFEASWLGAWLPDACTEHVAAF